MKTRRAPNPRGSRFGFFEIFFFEMQKNQIFIFIYIYIYIWAIFLLSSHFCGTTSQNRSKFWYVVKHKKVSLQKNFQPPSCVPPFVCGAHLKVQNNPFFRVFYLFSNAHYSKQNWYFLIQRQPKSWFFGLVYVFDQRDTLFCNPSSVVPISRCKITPFLAFCTFFQMLITRSRIDIF